MSERNRDISEELGRVLERYEGDVHRILGEHVRLDYLYALSGLRENLVEWYPFKREGTLLEVGSGYGALTGGYSGKVSWVDVLDESDTN